MGVCGPRLGALPAAALSRTLAALLTGVFDPPPDRLTVPWPYLLAGLMLSLAAAGAATVVSARRPPLSVLRDL
ncbi:hypothetical protein ACPPVO_36945 [Dactylosporangium sp. McL0621]|uniref:hypothetical protein n=1 Tax=Dactylosporangium sp. McL0621 TaxID=3415678 RepID=UPI003CFAB53B